MAVTDQKKYEEVVYTPQEYNGLKGLSSGTAQNMGKYQRGYNPSQTVLDAQKNLQAVQNQKPKGYTSRYQDQLDAILNQITNPAEFKWSFNGDELFKSYADQYSQDAKQASMDAIGQMAALTGGYGNTAAQAAGNQAYQQQMLKLYDRGFDLYDRALQKYRDDQAALKDTYGVLQGAEAVDYGRYRDTMSDWESELNRATNAYNTERNFDYGQYSDALNYWTGLAKQEYGQYSSDRELAAQYCIAALNNGKMPSADLLARAGLTEEDAQAMLVIPKSSGGSGGRKKTQEEEEPAAQVAIPAVGAGITGVLGGVKKAAQTAIPAAGSGITAVLGNTGSNNSASTQKAWENTGIIYEPVLENVLKNYGLTTESVIKKNNKK